MQSIKRIGEVEYLRQDTYFPNSYKTFKYTQS